MPTTLEYKVPHLSAKASHYDRDAATYDEFNEKNSAVINRTIEKTLKKYRVETILDLTCGTGTQVFWMTKRGYKVTGSDFNSRMLSVAKNKAKKEGLRIKFVKGDMRTAEVGKFDAVLTIFNAVGHLTQRDFEKAMRNIRKNLNDGGLYIFDIFNLNYLLKDNQITKLTIDWQTSVDDTRNRIVQHSTISDDGILASHTVAYAQKGSRKPKCVKSTQTLQVYSVRTLTEMLKKTGFKVLSQSAVDGKRFVDSKSERILIVAQR